jgi:DNA invertase Pin-like site-specific DNA recombinase
MEASMSSGNSLPAAQYLRMSTDRQEYSLDNQADVIRKYAGLQGFEIVKTYTDEAKSGLLLKHRRGLAQLLSDVVGGPQPYNVILVYDVSRWGRFQDADEAAYYEFLCKSAGLPIHYCAEQFVNDGAMPNVVMKALKRAMAAEYSRELSVKVFEGEKRISQLGFWVGSVPGYGLRRMLCSSDGTHKQIMEFHERKNLTTDRVILVPGPAEEVETVRKIFRMVLEGHILKQIADQLNEQHVKGPRGGNWCTSTVCDIVKNPKYMGTQIWARSTGKLGQPRVRTPDSEWVIRTLAFEAIIDEPTFTAAQELIAHTKPDQYLLDRLRLLLATEGSLGRSEIRITPGMPCEETYVNRFGSLTKAFALVGFERRDLSRAYQAVRRVQRLRSEVVKSLLNRFPKKVRLQQENPQHRPILHFDGARPLLVVVCKCLPLRNGEQRWILSAHIKWNYPVILCWCNRANTEIEKFSVFRSLPRGQLTFAEDDFNSLECRSATDVCSLLGSKDMDKLLRCADRVRSN